MATYVMSDLHGQFELLKTMLEKIEFSDSDRLIILGDVVDRGPQPMDILLYIMDKHNIELIKGNHENMFMEYINAGEFDKAFMRYTYDQNGGTTTLDQYEKLSKENKFKIRKYLEKLPLYKIVETKLENYILVHSGINMSGIQKNAPIGEILCKQSEDDILWSREEFYMFSGVDGYTIIFGHTPTPYLHEYYKTEIAFDIWYDPKYYDKIGIDCGAVFEVAGGRLACLRLEDQEEFYVENTKERKNEI